MRAQNYPTLEQFADNLATVMDKIECIQQPLYDFQVYPTAGLNQFLFFQQPQGAGFSASPGNAGATKVITDTNMTQNGLLPSPQAYFVEGIEVLVDPGSSAATVNTYALQIPSAMVAAAAAGVQAGAHDVNAIYTGGVLQLSIGQKPYYTEAPLYQFPPSSTLAFDGAIASNSATAGEVLKEKLRAFGNLCKLDPGFGIMTGQNFLVTILFPALVATPSGLNARIGVELTGWLFRAAQ